MGPADNGGLPPPVQLENFEGPLDLLLDEIRRQNLPIEKVPMAPITNRFLEYVRTASRQNLNLNIEWLHMAATLIHWKSQSLLPAQPGIVGPDPIPDELVSQLLAHKRQLAEELARRQSLAEASFSRASLHPTRENDEVVMPAEAPSTTVWEMIQQAREIALWIRRHREDRRQGGVTFGIEPDEVSVSEMIAYLQNHLAVAPDCAIDGLQLLTQQPSTAHRSCLFLAMLEMARDRQLEIRQSGHFAPISLSRIAG